MLDSTIYGSSWRSERAAALFDEQARTRAWLDILATIADVEGELGVIPASAAAAVARACRDLVVDEALIEELRIGRERSGHSTQGLISAVARRCPGDAGEWVHFGATVQDLTDTWFMWALARARRHLESSLDAADEALVALARAHRDTPMVGRTHGQPGAPITFGLKAASWLAELRRGHERLAGAAGRMDVGQLCGGVGSAAALGPRARDVQREVMARLGLRPPDVSWTSSRDAWAEWGAALAIVSGTAARIGHEIYDLQRPELGELAEPPQEGVVGSITMPHKRNPERSEQIGTLARLVRHLAAGLLEGMVHDHERDGRSWKAEWHLLPELTSMALRAAELLAELLAGLRVEPARMRENLFASGQLAWSEALTLALAPVLGRGSAHAAVSAASVRARGEGLSLRAAAAREPAIASSLPAKVLDALFERPELGACGEMVDRVLGRS